MGKTQKKKKYDGVLFSDSEQFASHEVFSHHTLWLTGLKRLILSWI